MAPELATVFEQVHKAYASITADNAESRRQLSSICNSLREWFQSSPRFMTSEAQYCLERFVSEELAHKPDEYQMPAPMKDMQLKQFFGKRHEKLLSTKSARELSALTALVVFHVACGYLFSEYVGYDGRLHKRTASELYDIWSPLTLSKLIASFDPKSKDEGDIQRIWMTSTAEPIARLMENWGSKWEGENNWILTRYFYAGRLLRCLEAMRLTDDEVKQLHAGGF